MAVETKLLTVTRPPIMGWVGTHTRGGLRGRGRRDGYSTGGAAIQYDTMRREGERRGGEGGGGGEKVVIIALSTHVVHMVTDQSIFLTL